MTHSTEVVVLDRVGWDRFGWFTNKFCEVGLRNKLGQIYHGIGWDKPCGLKLGGVDMVENKFSILGASFNDTCQGCLGSVEYLYPGNSCAV